MAEKESQLAEMKDQMDAALFMLLNICREIDELKKKRDEAEIVCKDARKAFQNAQNQKKIRAETLYVERPTLSPEDEFRLIENDPPSKEWWLAAREVFPDAKAISLELFLTSPYFNTEFYRSIEDVKRRLEVERRCLQTRRKFDLFIVPNVAEKKKKKTKMMKTKTKNSNVRKAPY